MQLSMLTEPQIQFLREEKSALTTAIIRLAEINLPADSLATLKEATLQLDELFLLVFVGEFNAGKSALINAILGERVLPEGVTPTTSRVTLIKWGETKSEQVLDEGFTVITHPLPLLKELNIVDSPGTNALIRQHERLTDEYVPRSDLVLFITSADRPLTESERVFLERILAWGKKVVFVMNKIDIFENENAEQEAAAYILNNVSSILGKTPELFPVSARLAQRSLMETDESERARLWTASRLDDLERYLDTTLKDSSRLSLKLQNPLGVAENLISQANQMIQTQSDGLEEDRSTVSALETTVTAYERDLGLELPPRLAEVDNILHRVEIRGLDFFDRTLRLTNIHHLIRGDRVRNDFEKEVVQGLPQEVDDQVQRLIDWLVDKDLHEWQQVMVYLQRRQAVNAEHVVGGGLDPQAGRRRDLIDNVGKKVKTLIDDYDQTREASKLAANVEAAVAQTAMFEVGAVGLGALVSTALLSSALDVTGIIAAGTLAIVGFFVIPYKRKKAKDDFRQKVTDLRTSLHNTLTSTFEHETRNAVSRLKDNLTPYTRFVYAEQERIQKSQSALEDLLRTIRTLRARISQVVE